jgi:hypothetical protein
VLINVKSFLELYNLILSDQQQEVNFLFLVDLNNHHYQNLIFQMFDVIDNHYIDIIIGANNSQNCSNVNRRKFGNRSIYCSNVSLFISRRKCLSRWLAYDGC